MTNKEIIETYASQLSGTRGDYWNHIRRTGLSVKMEAMSAVLTEEQISIIIERAYPKPRDCFKNAFRIAELCGCQYVEGLVNYYGVPIEHAWNKTEDGRYFDATYELNGLMESEEYTEFFDGTYPEIASLDVESGVYGGYSYQSFCKSIRKEVK